MIPYEFSSQEYSYALFLSYEYDLYPSHPLITNMVSERYPRDEDDEDDASDSASECDADFSDGVPHWLFFDAQEEDAPQESPENVHHEIVFGSFAQDSDSLPAPALASIKPKIDGSSITIGTIACCFVRRIADEQVLMCKVTESERQEEEGTIWEASKSNSSITAKIDVSEIDVISEIDEKSKKHDAEEKKQGQPPQVLPQIALPSCDSDRITFFSIDFFCKSGSEISTLALSMATMTLPALPLPWFSTCGPWFTTKVDDLTGSPMTGGNLEELIDENHTIVSSSVGLEYECNTTYDPGGASTPFLRRRLPATVSASFRPRCISLVPASPSSLFVVVRTPPEPDAPPDLRGSCSSSHFLRYQRL